MPRDHLGICFSLEYVHEQDFLLHLLQGDIK